MAVTAVQGVEVRRPVDEGPCLGIDDADRGGRRDAALEPDLFSGAVDERRVDAAGDPERERLRSSLARFDRVFVDTRLAIAQHWHREHHALAVSAPTIS